MVDVEQVAAWSGRDAYDRDGEKMGQIEAIYLDRSTDRPQWALVSTGLPKGEGFVPRRQVQEAAPPVSQRTVETAKENVDVLKTRAKEARR